MFVKTLPLQWW